MLTHPLAAYFWMAYNIVLGGLFIGAAIYIFKQRGPGATLMLVGGILSAAFGTGAQIFTQIGIRLDWDVFSPGSPTSASRTLEALWAISTLGSLASHVGFLLHALRLKTQSSRVAELERIISEQTIAGNPGA
ncbi:MAG: hypothetical protein AAGB14_15950 [Verrucomicrobiota bacterium]